MKCSLFREIAAVSLLNSAVAAEILDPFAGVPDDRPLSAVVGELLDVANLNQLPAPIVQTQPDYPYNLRRAGITGAVEVGFIVDTEGRVRDPWVMRSTNPGFERAAVHAVSTWKFQPGRRDGRPVNVRMSVTIDFSFTGQESVDPWAIKKLPNQDQLPPEFQWDSPPSHVYTVCPVYPFEMLRDGQGDTIKLGYVVGPTGRVVRVNFGREPAVPFAQAIRAMLDCWKFEPARKAGQPCFALVVTEMKFTPSGAGLVVVSDNAREILKELQKKKSAVYSLKDLDAVPAPIARPSPVYPETLRKEGLPGTAVIEFFIDRQGDAQLPRIVSSSHEEFGYAAAQAVAAWRFAPPRKNKKAAIARVQVPFEFAVGNPPPGAGK